MNSKEKREEITALIDNIKEHSDRLDHMPHMPLLEVSAILSKINRLHESTVVLKYILAKEQHHEDEEFGSEASEEEYEELEIEIEMEDDGESDSFDDYDDDHEQEDDLDVDEEEIELDSEMEAEHSQPSVEEVRESDDAETTIADLEEESGLSSKSDVNEQYAEGSEDRSLSEQLKKQPIADLMTAIGLNERYLYANDLFGGDIDEFRKVIRILNDFNTEVEAVKYFNEELRRSYGWEEDDKLAEALFSLVKRRFQ